MAENNLHERLDDYVNDLFVHEDDALAWIKAETSRHDMPAINLKSFEGRLLQMLIYMLGARKVVEIGTLAGYSAVWIARALPAGGKLYTLEKSSKHAGVGDRVELLEGDAHDSLRKITAKGPFDLVFIDADKGGYIDYLAWAVDNLRPGGMVAAHNAFRHGAVLAPENDDDRTIQAFNAALAKDTRLESTILAVGDGMAVGIKR